ncbi:pilus assembly protein [Xaviernesmea oryzae]|uniref:Pilus assembly protein n=1 Tax=Xaviernesmea oryzae TaxID=464029 RepID=A0A1Q9B2M4_9HYPH|nr:type II secretion system F family protein [Xaviernesmea oryzae]OLP62267.1 pilus assembly protein [Xaviernesmea oryzae]SEL93903.1 tight adherence protein B [Xaviernesmea oryzae]
MFGLDPTVLLLSLSIAVAVGGVAYALLFSQIERQKKTESRLRKVQAAETDRAKVRQARDRMNEMSKRRKSVQDSLKELERKKQEKSASKASVKMRLPQAGLSITPLQFHLGGAAFGLLAGLVVLVMTGQMLAALGTAIAMGLGLPRWGLAFLVRRRTGRFLDEFPNALDAMVRAVKSGLPLTDAVRMIASEGREPVKSEFRRVVEAQQIGLGVPEACQRMAQTMPLAEVSFFAIVVTIQAQAGGNLSEAIGNLSKVLRERRKMKAKVQAMSMEAKASATIIGALPFIVALLVYLTTPSYIAILFSDTRGHLILAASGVWMSLGILVMRQMINFDI